MTSCSAWRCTYPHGGALTTFPYKLRAHFFLRPGVHVHPLAAPMAVLDTTFVQHNAQSSLSSCHWHTLCHTQGGKVAHHQITPIYAAPQAAAATTVTDAGTAVSHRALAIQLADDRQQAVIARRSDAVTRRQYVWIAFTSAHLPSRSTECFTANCQMAVDSKQHIRTPCIVRRRSQRAGLHFN